MQVQVRTARHPGGETVEFHSELHNYVYKGENLPSVTRLIHRWFPKFDSESVAKRKAEREGGSYEALVREWNRKREDAAAFGSKIHLMAERIIVSGDARAADDLAQGERERTYLEAVKESLRRIDLGYEIVDTEKIVFSPALKVAGTIDLLLRSRSTGEFVIADWKTNREIKYSSYREEKGFGPCVNLENCNFNHYSLQVSSYAELLSSEGYLQHGPPVRGVLLHLFEKAGRVGCSYIKTKAFTLEAKSILTAAYPPVSSMDLSLPAVD